MIAATMLRIAATTKTAVRLLHTVEPCCCERLEGAPSEPPDRQIWVGWDNVLGFFPSAGHGTIFLCCTHTERKSRQGHRRNRDCNGSPHVTLHLRLRDNCPVIVEGS